MARSKYLSATSMAVFALTGRALYDLLVSQTVLTVLQFQFTLLMVLAVFAPLANPLYIYKPMTDIITCTALVVIGRGWENFQNFGVNLGLQPNYPSPILLTVGLFSPLAYVAFIEITQIWMGTGKTERVNPTQRKRRQQILKFETLHNHGLAFISLLMLIGIVRSCIVSGKLTSFHALLCWPFKEDSVFRLTAHLFFWTKLWEWGDSALLIAKGKPIIWLHYTHHASTAILTALNMVPRYNAMWAIPCATNSLIHFWMYSYYAYPRILSPFKKALTKAQIIQHAVVLFCAASVLYELGFDGWGAPSNPVRNGVQKLPLLEWSKSSYNSSPSLFAGGLHALQNNLLLDAKTVTDHAPEVEDGGWWTGGGQCANTAFPVTLGVAFYFMYLAFFLMFYVFQYVTKVNEQVTAGGTPLYTNVNQPRSINTHSVVGGSASENSKNHAE